MFVSDLVIHEKEKRVQYTMNMTLHIEQQTFMQFSNCWLHGSGRHNNFKFYRFCSVHFDGAVNWKAELKIG